MCFFADLINYGGGDSRKPTKNQGEIQGIAENQVFWLDFCAKKRTVHTLSGYLFRHFVFFRGFKNSLQ
jgi:hypothetical protein